MLWKIKLTNMKKHTKSSYYQKIFDDKGKEFFGGEC